MSSNLAQSPDSDEPQALAAAYDEVPYISYPFPQTSPLWLQGIARLFGLNAPSPATARILEIGCASGNNIVTIASIFPASQCVGFDYSERQIAMGKKAVKAAGLKNM